MKHVTIILAFLLIQLAGFAQGSHVLVVNFEKDKALLTENATASIDAFLQSVPVGSRITSVRIEGHTDLDGSEDYNQDLSRRRAEVVRAYAEKSGLEPHSFKVTYNGELKPLIPEKSESDKAQNRRVEIEISFAAPDNEPSVSEILFNHFYSPQVFNLNPGRDTVISTDRGTVISIPANAFDLRHVVCNIEKVKFAVEEAFDKDEMVLLGLSTQSNDHMLETGGMVHLDATMGQCKLSLAEGKTLKVYQPNESNLNGIQLFYEDPSNPGGSNWVLANTDVSSVGMPGENLSDDFFIGWGGVADKVSCAQCGMYFRFPPRRWIARWRCYMGASVCGRDRRSMIAEFKKYGVSSYSEYLDVKYKDEIEKYKAKDYRELQNILRKLELQDQITSGSVSGWTVSNFVYQTARLGWINCDRFSRYSARDLTNVSTPIKLNKSISASLIFKNIRSAMASSSSDRVAFNRVPIGELVSLVVIKTVAGKLQLAIHDMRVGDNVPKNLNYHEIGLDELQEKLSALN